MQWQVRLVGDLVDLEMLSDSFSDPDWRISKEDASYILTSIHLEHVAEVNDVLQLTQQFLEKLNGACRLLLGSRRPIDVGPILHRPKFGSPSISIQAGCAVAEARALPVSAKIVGSKGETTASHPAHAVLEVMSLAGKDPATARVLSLLESGDYSWVNLYRIYEVIRADCNGEDEIVAKGWGTRRELKAFTHTANSPGVLGKESRHGSENTQPPRNPLRLSLAKELVLRITRAWIDKKIRTP